MPSFSASSLLALIDLAIALTVLELGALLAWRHWRGRGPAAGAVLPNLLAGLCLMGAVRSALAPEPGLAVLVWLAAGGVAHATDIWRRWPRAG